MQFLSARHQRLQGNRDFLSCLYLPIQRMIAYDTLLNSILSHTPSAAVVTPASIDGEGHNDSRFGDEWW